MRASLNSALAVLLFAPACMSSSPSSKDTVPENSDAKPSLGIHGDWNDPESDYPKAIVRTPGDARKNPAAKPIVIKNATILTAAGKRHQNGTLVLEGGAITFVGTSGAPTPAGATVIDATGKFVTPGIIDTHSHIGVYSAPHTRASSDGNEVTSPITAHARAEYGYFPGDPAITRAVAGGITSAQILPGSANLIGGLGFTVIMRPGRIADDVRFPGAPKTIKMACGENPKRVYGDKGGPQTRMAEYAAFRQAFHDAAAFNAKLLAYKRNRELWQKKRLKASELDEKAKRAGKDDRFPPEPAPEPPPRDLKTETLAAVLRGEVLVNIHCYRADEIQQMVAIADDFGFKIRSFHHALEAYKVRDMLVAHDIAISTWADWYGFKMEAFDGIPHNAALFQAAGGRPVIHSDSSIGIQRLNQEASKAMWSGRHAGIKITEDQALRWVTANAAWVLGIQDVTGTLETGKRADVVVWSAHPFSVYAKPDIVIQGGEIAYRRSHGLTPTDFELGNSAVDEKAGDR